MRGLEVVSARVADHGVDTIFGLLGHGNLELMDHWARVLGRRYIAARHESGAVAMARGYARASGKVAVATVTHGPGLTNAITALVASTRGRTEMVLLAGDTGEGTGLELQDIDQASVVEPTGAGFIPVSRADDLWDAVDEAFVRAAGEHRPMVLNLPVRVQHESCSRSAPIDIGTQSWARSERTVPGDEELDSAAKLVAAAHRPLVVAGRGALHAGARESLLRLAQRIGARVGTTLPIHGYFRGSDLDVGVVGGFATEATVEYARDVDCVLAFGTSLHPRTTKGGRLFADGAKILQCDTSPEAIGRHIDVDCALVGDAVRTVEALLDRLPERATAGRMPDSPLPRVRREMALPVPEADRLDPRAVALELDAVLPKARTLVVDGGHSTGFTSIYTDIPDMYGYHLSLGDYSSIGLGVGMAIGTAVARPDRLSVLCIGDGSLMMQLGELETIRRHDIPMLVVVMNDGAYGSEIHTANMLGFDASIAEFDNPSFASLAEVLGFETFTVRTLARLRELESRIKALQGPMLLDCLLDPTIMGPWLRDIVGERHAISAA